MRLAIKNPSDVLTGSIMLAVGILALYLGKDLNFGTLARMGSGFIPRIVAGLIVVLSMLVIFRGIRFSGENALEIKIVPLLGVALAPVLFAILIRPTGLFVTAFAVFSLVRIACTKKFGLEALLAPLILAAAVCVIFIGLLGQPLPLFWF